MPLAPTGAAICVTAFVLLSSSVRRGGTRSALLDSRQAWLLALVFGGFIAGSPLPIGEPLIHPALRGFALAYMVAAASTMTYPLTLGRLSCVVSGQDLGSPLSF